MKISWTIAAAAFGTACAVALATGQQTVAQEKTITLKFSHWVPATHPLHKPAEEWLQSIEKDSGGTLKYQIFPAQQLGKAFDHYNMARDGIADITMTNPGYEPGRFPIVAAAELPFLFSNATGGTAAFDAWYRKYAKDEMKDVINCIGYVHDPGTFHMRTKKIVVPADVAGTKIRPGHATLATWITMLGGTNVQAAAPETRDVIEKGVADGLTFPWNSVILFVLDKVTKYHMDAALYVSQQNWLINKATYDSMSPRQKKVIDDHCTTEWAEKIATPWAEFEAAGRAKIKAMPDHEVYSLTEAQLGEWKKSGEQVKAKWAEGVKKLGLDPDKVLGELTDSLKKYNALY
jgi:TRAP-type C4-dicarboxylate transport system substrate-binding protein